MSGGRVAGGSGPSHGSTLVRRPAAELLHGCVHIERQREGWVRPWRLTPHQMRALGSCQAWHPGLFRQMAAATSGICLELETDSSEVALQLRLDEEPSGTARALDYVPQTRGEGMPAPYDGLSVEVDGRRLSARMPAVGECEVRLALDDPAQAPAAGAIMQLPGLGDTHHVRVWLPLLRGCSLREVLGNGTSIEPVPQRRQLLVLGDSIAQGFVAGEPAHSWTVRVARRLGLDLVNQGISGQVFQPGTVLGLQGRVDPACIVVELGENYRYEPCRARLVARDIRSYLTEVSRLWPQVPTFALTPLWHAEDAWPSHAMSCWKEVPRLICAHALPHEQMHVVDGATLLEARTSLLADGYEHPGAQGNAQIASRLGAFITAHTERDEDLRARAVRALEGAPRGTLPLREMLRRGLGAVTYASAGCVLMTTSDGIQTFWARDRDEGRDVIATLVDAPVVVALEPALVRDIELMRGLTEVRPYSLSYYEDEPLPVDVHHPIRVLDESHLPQVCEEYLPLGFATEDELRTLLRAGGMLGGFDGGRLVGFVGEHPCGSLGMLQVLRPFRRRGWGRALMAAKINEQLARGWTPWSETFPDNKASLALQRSLGLHVTPANEQCYLSAPTNPTSPSCSSRTQFVGD